MSAAVHIAAITCIATLAVALALGALGCGRYGPPIRPTPSTSAEPDLEMARRQAAEEREREREPVPFVFEGLDPLVEPEDETREPQPDKEVQPGE